METLFLVSFSVVQNVASCPICTEKIYTSEALLSLKKVKCLCGGTCSNLDCPEVKYWGKPAEKTCCFDQSKNDSGWGGYFFHSKKAKSNRCITEKMQQ